MKTLIITVAGMATRFSQSIGRECLKCMYFEKSYTESILYRLIHMQETHFEQIVIVGGFRYEELETGVAQYFKEDLNRIYLVYNEHFSDYGSGYSLYLGIKKAMEMGSSEIVFAEGDLYVDADSFAAICIAPADVVTTNIEPILAIKSVAFYFDKKNVVHYIFDTKHGELEIKEPFLEIRNSGQIWKFSNMERLKNIILELSEKEKQATNLVIVQKYFEQVKREELQMICFKNWINCNTVSDFRKIADMEGLT